MQILLDMDGVLADFFKQACKYHGKPYIPSEIKKYNISEIWEMSDDEFWEPLQGFDFWSGIEPYDYTEALLQDLRKIAPITICTAPSRDHYCISGKLSWLEKHLKIKTSDVIFANKKWLLANGSNCLIDDSQEKIDDFCRYGGNGIIFPQPWNNGVGNWRSVINKVAEKSK